MGKQPTTTERIWLYLTEERQNGYYHLKATVVRLEAGDKVRNTEFAHGLYVDNLEVNSQGHDEDNLKDGGRHLYAWEVRFKPFVVEQRDAERMVKTFKMVERKLAKLEAQLGRPVTFGQYLGRVALALGAEGFVGARGQKIGWNYDDRQHQFLSLRDGIAQADYLAQCWAREGQEAK